MALSILLIGGLFWFRAPSAATSTIESAASLNGEDTARQLTEPSQSRSIHEPVGAGRSVGEPHEESDVPTALSFAESLAPTTTTPPEVQPDANNRSTTTDSNGATSAPSSPSTAVTQTNAVAPAQVSPATTAPPKSETTTPPKKAAPTKTTTPPTTATPVTAAPPATKASSSGSAGCQTNCRSVGFQNLDGKSDVILENLIISNPNGRCISMVGSKNITIRNVTVRDCGTQKAVSSHYDTGLINIENATNISLEGSLIDNMSNEGFGAERNNAIQIASGTNITIRNNTIQNVRSDISQKDGDKGSRAIKIHGNSSAITIDKNRFYNAGRNAVQVSRVRGAANMTITNNVIEGRGRWDSDYEDMINLYSSSGTSSSPIRIAGNRLRNGGPSTTGTGMILGDGSSSVGPSQYIVAENNVLIDPGHVGINLAGGDHITVRNNTILGSGNVPHKTTVGMTINHYGYSSECRDHVVTGNRVWMDNQHLPKGVNHAWIPGTCTTNVQIDGNTFGDATLKN